MLRGFARPHLDIKQMLLFALTRIRDALVAGRRLRVQLLDLISRSLSARAKIR